MHMIRVSYHYSKAGLGNTGKKFNLKKVLYFFAILLESDLVSNNQSGNGWIGYARNDLFHLIQVPIQEIQIEFKKIIKP